MKKFLKLAVLPAWATPYARLMRLDRPIGWWLLLLPCWWSIALAAPGWPPLGLMALFGIGAIVMRGAGCIVNDIYDRKLDAKVERTKNRPLANGEITLPWAFAFLALLLLIGLGVLLCLNPVAIGLGLASLILVALYPLMKRITWWPQLFLGLTFNWGALMGWAAVSGRLAPAAILLYAAGICWTLGYDTIYAQQDIRDDEIAGIKSTARLFGAHIRPIVCGFYAACFMLLALAGWVAQLGALFYAGLAIAALYGAVQLALWRLSDPADCLQRFKANRDMGLIVLAALIAGRLL